MRWSGHRRATVLQFFEMYLGELCARTIAAGEDLQSGGQRDIAAEPVVWRRGTGAIEAIAQVNVARCNDKAGHGLNSKSAEQSWIDPKSCSLFFVAK